MNTNRNQKCGRYFEDDFVELVPGAASRFERQLRLLASSNALHNTETGHDTSLLSTYPESTPSPVALPAGQAQPVSQNPANPSIAGSPASNAQQPPVPSANNPLQGILSPNPLNTYAPSRQQPETPTITNAGPRWLLICSRPHKLPTSLSQLDFADVYNDKVMFRDIKDAYRNRKSGRHLLLSIFGVIAIRFVRVSFGSLSSISIFS